MQARPASACSAGSGRLRRGSPPRSGHLRAGCGEHGRCEDRRRHRRKQEEISVSNPRPCRASISRQVCQPSTAGASVNATWTTSGRAQTSRKPATRVSPDRGRRAPRTPPGLAGDLDLEGLEDGPEQPVLSPKWCTKAPRVTPAAAVIRSAGTPENPCPANSTRAASISAALVVSVRSCWLRRGTGQHALDQQPGQHRRLVQRDERAASR